MSDCGNPAPAPLVVFPKEAAVQQQRRQDDSWGASDWIELADTVLDLSGAILDVAFDVAAGVLEGAGSLLDIF
jgi:hypothetical protein